MDDRLLCGYCIASSIVLLGIANGMPVIARNLFADRFALPVDFGKAFYDRRPIFGYSKTWRGISTSVIVTTLFAPFINISMIVAIMFSLLAMLGDLFSSFTKRRLGYRESSRSRLLDVIPESALPLVLLQEPLGLSWLAVLLTIIIFFLLEVILSPLLYRLHIRKRPY